MSSQILIILSVVFLGTCLAKKKEKVEEINLRNGLTCAGEYCLPEDYDKLKLPFDNNGMVEVAMDFDSIQILDVDDTQFAISFSLYFGVRWNEHRLVGPKPDDENFYYPLDSRFIENLWVPDIYLWYLSNIGVINFLIPFSGLWIKNGSHILYSQEAHITFWCPMRFELYPLDRQVCQFPMASYAYGLEKMQYSTNLLTFNVSKRNTIQDYEISIIPLREESLIFTWLDIANYSRTGFEFVLSRYTMKYIVNYYLPSGLFVVTSWASFLIPPEIIPGRMTLLVMLFLVLINIFTTTTSISPNVEGLSAMSAWVIACILFVFGALIGFAAILLLRKHMSLKDFSRKAIAPSDYWYGYRLEYIDKTLVILFPVLFLLFNLVYWPMCLK